MSNLPRLPSRRPTVAWFLAWMALVPLASGVPAGALQQGAGAGQGGSATPPPDAAAPPAAPSTPAGQAPAAAAGQPPASHGAQSGAVAGPEASPGGLTVDVWALDPDVQELHLDVRDNLLNLTLEQAVEVALRRNLALVLQRYIRNEARLGVEQALGLYDLNLTGLLQYNTQKEAAAAESPENPTSESTLEWKLGLTQQLPSGASANVTWDNLREVVAGNPEFFLITTFYQPALTFNLTQPLLKGFGSTVTEEPILLAQNTSEVNRSQFELSIITVAVQVIDDYWALVNAREQLVVAQESLQLARDLNERNRIQVQVGTLAPLEIVQSEAAIATREQDIITAQQVIGDAADALRLALNLPPGDLWHLEILPTTPPETPSIQINLQDSIETAIANRVEVRNEKLSVERAKIVDKVAKNSLLPSLNLVSSYNLSSLNLTYASSLSQISGFDFPGWSVGLQFTFPLQNRAARAAKAIADLDVNRFNWELDQEKRQVLMEVRKAVRGIDTAEKVIVAAHASRQFQEKNLDAEKKRYENGMSTSFLVTQIQDQLTQAKQAEVNAVVGYRTALAEYYRSVGKLVPELGIKIIDPKEAVNRFTFHKANLLP
jgi:outer membrane protein